MRTSCYTQNDSVPYLKEITSRYNLKKRCIRRKRTSSPWANFFPTLILLSRPLRMHPDVSANRELKKCAMQTTGIATVRRKFVNARPVTRITPEQASSADCGGRKESRWIKWAKKREHNTISITKRGSVHWIQIPVFPRLPSSFHRLLRRSLCLVLFGFPRRALLTLIMARCVFHRGCTLYVLPATKTENSFAEARRKFRRCRHCDAITRRELSRLVDKTAVPSD